MSILIKNGLIFDGSGAPPFKNDIFINHQRISRIGNFSHRLAEQVIDAHGMPVVPGFIDINSDADHCLSIFNEPFQSDYLSKGITTIIGGNAGASLAPLLDGSLRAVRKWADPSLSNVNWRRLSEFFDILKKQKLGVNFGTLIGHSTIRRAIIGESLRDLTDKEIGFFKRVLTEGLKEGAFGFSVGLNFVHSRRAPFFELRECAQIVRSFKAVYSVQLRDCRQGLLTGVEEILKLARETKANMEISGMQPFQGWTAQYLQAISLIERERNHFNIHFDFCPAAATAVAIYSLLPEWAQSGGLETMLKHMATPHLREKILKSLNDSFLEDIVIQRVPAVLKFLSGKSLKEFSQTQNLTLTEALLKLMELSQLKAEVLRSNTDFSILPQILFSENSLVASGGALKFLDLVQKENLIPLEKAVMKLTSLPARKFGLKERGLLAEGYFADIVVLRDGKPGEVLVNGSLVLEDGETKKVLAGQVLRRGK